jgi:hypothetical protein
MAEIQRASAIANPPNTRMPDEVARYIVEAIFDVDGPQRYGSDETSQEMLETWRVTSDEVLAEQILATYSSIIPGRDG